MKLRKAISLMLLVLSLCPFIFMGAVEARAPTIKDARKHAEDMLLPVEGVVGISHREYPPKIIVYIEHEKYRSKVPSKIDGFATETKVIGAVKALSLLQLETVKPYYTYTNTINRASVVRPIVGGISLGVPVEVYGGKMAGTLGIVTKDGYILSCAHVIAMNIIAQFPPSNQMGAQMATRFAVIQPGTYDGGTIKDKVGFLYRYTRITFGPRSVNYADAAIAKVTIPNYVAGEVLDSDNKNTYTISGTVEVNVGDSVRKSGRTTGVTVNVVFDTSATVKVWYGTYRWAIFYDQILVYQPFVSGGDSGSLVDKNGAFVGLAFAGSDTAAVVCKAKYIISALGIKI